MPARPPKRPAADPKSFDEAVTWFRDRLVMTDDEFDSIETASHATAFTVAGVAQLDLVTQVWEAADRAIAQGETLESFQKSMGDKLAAAWGKDMPWRVETIYRTNVQSAYSRGRWLQMNHPAVLQARPWRKFSAIMDGRTSAICGPCDGTVRAADDPWWQDHVPPLHHNCRSHLVTLSDAEAQKEGVSKAVPEVDADVGFGDAPSPTPKSAWQPDLTQYPAPLASTYHAPTVPKPRPAPAPPPPPPSLPAPVPVLVPAPGPMAPPPEGVKGQPFRPAVTVTRAIEGLQGHGFQVQEGETKGKYKTRRVPDADRLGYLNHLLEVLHDIRERFPHWYSKLNGRTKVDTYPVEFTVGGVFRHSGRAIAVPADDMVQWAKWMARKKAIGVDPATTLDEHQGFSRQTFRHELAHALDVLDKMSPTTWSHYELSDAGTAFNAEWQKAAKKAGLPVNSLVRQQVSHYATTNLRERFAETVMMVSSPSYKTGMLPANVESLVLELLEKGTTA